MVNNAEVIKELREYQVATNRLLDQYQAISEQLLKESQEPRKPVTDGASSYGGTRNKKIGNVSPNFEFQNPS